MEVNWNGMINKMNKYEKAFDNISSLAYTSDHYKPDRDDEDIKLI